MRIQGLGTGAVEERDRSKAEPSTQIQPNGTQASVVVSTGAQKLSAAVSAGSAAQKDHVAAIRAQVQAGTYKIDRDRLASRIADDELERAGAS